ncbi:glycoside hydrolase family 2 TIM barrel-domain containing protein, partial [Lutibacter sp.]|uniref:glycoside hydrolase family 2 TIM barrel-domain containing protein n=1 Tax=Lutibacter sp. TaxID=1925666 RepID=UPI002733B01B
NSFRTWRTENGKQTGKEVLDEAHKYGLMVTMGIEVARERHGFDYNDEVAVKKQLELIKQEVIALKDHPALLIWAIGNELNLRYTNPKVWDAVNDISKMIHEVDPNHLTTTPLAGISQKEIDLIKERSSDLDLLSFQMYGDLKRLPLRVKEYGWKGAYIVTEWGATGHWEVPKTEWGVPIEENSTLKAANYLIRYKGAIEADLLQCIGSYVFLWGNKQERTPTWYGIFLEDGNETESVDVMHYIWNNKWPENRAPQLESFTINGKTAYESITLVAENSQTASVKINDFENDTINYTWEILPESTDLKHGGDLEERPKSIDMEIVNQNEGEITFKSPKSGLYRLFVYAYDGQGNAANANIPFKVN